MNIQIIDYIIQAFVYFGWAAQLYFLHAGLLALALVIALLRLTVIVKGRFAMLLELLAFLGWVVFIGLAVVWAGVMDFAAIISPVEWKFLALGTVNYLVFNWLDVVGIGLILLVLFFLINWILNRAITDRLAIGLANQLHTTVPAPRVRVAVVVGIRNFVVIPLIIVSVLQLINIL